MSVMPSPAQKAADLSSIWAREARKLEDAKDVEWAMQTLVAHVRGQQPTRADQEALQSLSSIERSLLAVRSSSTLTTEAHKFIKADLDQLYASSHFDTNAIETLSRVSEIYTRWLDCLNLLGGATPSSLPLWIKSQVQNLNETIEKSIYNDLEGCRANNLYQKSLQRLGLESQWITFTNRAARRLVHNRSKEVEQNMDNFAEPALPNLQSWLKSSLLETLAHWQVPHLDSMYSRLEYEMCVELGHIRARQLFDIITDFPLSTPALEDLNVCGNQINLQPYTSRQLSRSLQARLLHPGASTRDIVEFYTHLIRALRFIDPTGVILSHVIGPVRTYLRARSDTISVIVASLLGQAGEFTLLRDMMREAGDAQGLGGGDTSIAVYDDEEDNSNDQSVAVNLMASDEANRMVVLPSADEEDWAPRPIDAGPDYRQSRKSDVIAIIVSIFDDEEGFVAALEKSCAEQLVKVQGYDTGKEYETNENLKKRFGDAPLSKCDVMLNDIKKSQRLDRSIQALQAIDASKSQAFKSLHPLILSRQFWPPMKEAVPVAVQSSSSMFGSAPISSMSRGASVSLEKTVKMPGQFAKAMEQYQEAFKSFAPMRRLRWLNVRNSIQLNLEMNDGRHIKETVTPLQAAIVEVAAGIKASKQQPMSISLLISELEVDKEAIMEAIYFWTSRKVLMATESDATSFEIVEVAKE